jgi:hypothetical protein
VCYSWKTISNAGPEEKGKLQEMPGEVNIENIYVTINDKDDASRLIFNTFSHE